MPPPAPLRNAQHCSGTFEHLPFASLLWHGWAPFARMGQRGTPFYEKVHVPLRWRLSPATNELLHGGSPTDQEGGGKTGGAGIGLACPLSDVHRCSRMVSRY